MENKVQLITYADRLGDGTLAGMTRILRERLGDSYCGVHILPFFTPFDGADAGFDPVDHREVDPRLGTWADVGELARTHHIMVDTHRESRVAGIRTVPGSDDARRGKSALSHVPHDVFGVP